MKDDGQHHMARKSILPPYFCWRNGRPRWVPGPALRKRGYKGRNLQRPDGSWMTKGEAIEEAEKINLEVKNGAMLEMPTSARTLSALIDRYVASDNYHRLSPRTARDYGRYLDLFREWAGDIPVDRITRAAISSFYASLRDNRGVSTAHAVIRVLRTVLNYGVKDLEWLDKNRASSLRMTTPEGRLVLWTPAEIIAFCAAADWMGLPSQADACMIGLCTGQNRADVITAPPFELHEGVFIMHRRKTGRVCYIPPVKPLMDRIQQMRARNAGQWPGVVFPTEIVSTHLQRQYPADGNYFIKEHMRVREVASGQAFAREDAARKAAGLPPLARNLPFTPCPSVINKTFQDLRDTAVTMLFAATKDIGRVANTTGHSLKTAQSIIDKHYFVRNAALALDAGEGFERLLIKSNIG